MLDNLARVAEPHTADEAVPYTVQRAAIPDKTPVAHNDARALPSHDKASHEARELISWCYDQQYLRPTKVLEVTGDPISVLARVAQRLPEMTDMGADSYDALLARLTEQVNEFSAAMTSGHMACKIMYQDSADDLSQTVKDGETRQFIAFTEDGQMATTGIQGRDRHLTLGGGGYQVDDMAQFQNALSDRRHIMIELYAKGSRDDVSADQSGVTHGMIAPLMEQLMAEPATLRAMATEIAQQERFAPSNDVAPSISNYLPEPVNMALASLAHSGAIAPASVESFVAPAQMTVQPLQQAQTIVQPEARRTDPVAVPQQSAPAAPQELVAQKPMVSESQQPTPAAPQAQPATVEQPKPAEQKKEEPVATIAMSFAPAAPVMAAPVIGMGGGSSSAPRAEAASFTAAKVESVSSAPATVEAPKTEAPKVEDKKQEQPVKAEEKKHEEVKVEAVAVAPVTVKIADPVKAPDKVEITQSAYAAPVPTATTSLRQDAAAPAQEAPRTQAAPVEQKNDAPRPEQPRAPEVKNDFVPPQQPPVQAEVKQPVQDVTKPAQPFVPPAMEQSQPKQAEPASPPHEYHQRQPRPDNVTPFPQREERQTYRAPVQDTQQPSWGKKPTTSPFTQPQQPTWTTGGGSGGGHPSYNSNPYSVNPSAPKQSPSQSFKTCCSNTGACGTAACPINRMNENINRSYNYKP